MHEVIKDVRTTTIREVVEDVIFEAQIETVVLNANPDQLASPMLGMPVSNTPVGSKRISSGTAVVNSTDGQSTIVIATFYKEHGNQLTFNTSQPDLYFVKVCSTLPTFINTINNL